MTSIDIFDPSDLGAALPELPPLPMGALVVGTLNLLQTAADLPSPHYLSICDTQAIRLQFPPDKASLKTITRWALRFGSVMISHPHQGKDGPEIWCHTEFSYYGVAVKVYAHIPARTATT